MQRDQLPQFAQGRGVFSDAEHSVLKLGNPRKPGQAVPLQVGATHCGSVSTVSVSQHRYKPLRGRQEVLSASPLGADCLTSQGNGVRAALLEAGGLTDGHGAGKSTPLSREALRCQSPEPTALPP